MDEFNYFVDGIGFKDYAQARIYADELLVSENKYRCVFTKSEMDSVDSFINQAKEYKE